MMAQRGDRVTRPAHSLAGRLIRGRPGGGFTAAVPGTADPRRTRRHPAAIHIQSITSRRWNQGVAHALPVHRRPWFVDALGDSQAG